MPEPAFSPRDLENLRRISLDGAQAAEQALKQITALPVKLEVRRVQTLAFPDVPALLGGEETHVVGIHLRVYGDCRANALLAFSPETALKIVNTLFPPGLASLDEMEELERSGLTELGNILTCAFTNALSVALRKSLVPGVPSLASDMAGALVDVLLIEQGQRSDTALVLQTEIAAEPDLRGHLLVMPDPASLPRILEALRDPAGP